MKNYFRKIIKQVDRAEFLIVLAGIIVYVIAACLVSLHRYWQYDAFWYDLGILDEAIWKLSRFQLPKIIQLAPPMGKIVWADHLYLSIAFLAPFYWLSDKTEIMLILQAVFVGASAFVGYLIAKKYIINLWVRISLIVSYLGFVGLQNALYTDIHANVFALLPLMLCIWAIYFKKRRLYWIFLLITFIFSLGNSSNLFLILKRHSKPSSKR